MGAPWIFAHRMHGMHRRFFYQRDYTDYTDFYSPQGICFICKIMLIICLRRITGISRIFFAHRMHGRFYYQRDYTDYTDFPRDTRDTRRQVNAPHGNCFICEIMLIYYVSGVSRGSARIFFLTQRRKGRRGFYIINWFYGLNRNSSWSSKSVETSKRSAWESVESVKSCWLLCLRRITGICAYLFLTQRRKGRKGFYIINWFYGLNRFSSWSSWSVEAFRRSAWQLFHLLNHVDSYISSVSRVSARIFLHDTLYI